MAVTAGSRGRPRVAAFVLIFGANNLARNIRSYFELTTSYAEDDEVDAEDDEDNSEEKTKRTTTK